LANWSNDSLLGVNSSSRTSLRSDGYTPNFLKNESNAVQMLLIHPH
jgi:hypothetical protein